MILIQPTEMLTHGSISKAQFGKKNVIQTIFFCDSLVGWKKAVVWKIIHMHFQITFELVNWGTIHPVSLESSATIEVDVNHCSHQSLGVSDCTDTNSGLICN